MDAAQFGAFSRGEAPKNRMRPAARPQIMGPVGEGLKYIETGNLRIIDDLLSITAPINKLTITQTNVEKRWGKNKIKNTN